MFILVLSPPKKNLSWGNPFGRPRSDQGGSLAAASEPPDEASDSERKRRSEMGEMGGLQGSYHLSRAAIGQWIMIYWIIYYIIIWFIYKFGNDGWFLYVDDGFI